MAGTATSSGRRSARKAESELPSHVQSLCLHLSSVIPGECPVPTVGANIGACVARCFPGSCPRYRFPIPVNGAPSHPVHFPTGGR